MPERIHPDLHLVSPSFAAALRDRRDEPYLVEHVLPPASDAEIRELESDLGVHLPASYKQLLRLSRGFWLAGGVVQLGRGHPFFHRFPRFEELTPQQRKFAEAKGGEWPPPSEGMLCFAEYFVDADGDQALWDVSQGLVNGEYPVYYYSHESRPPHVERIASSFAEWLGRCLEAFPPETESDA